MPNDTVRASAPALPKSRRDTLGLFASVPALAVLPKSAMAADSDAELFDLIRIWQEKVALTAAASRVHDETEELGYSVPRPAALVRTDEDASLCLCDLSKVGGEYYGSEIEGFRNGPISRYDYRRLIKTDGTSSDDAHILERVILSQAAQVRGQEIVAVYDEWTTAHEEAKRAGGADAAKRPLMRPWTSRTPRYGT
jgi:hypothetical protein